ncbi:MAG TPA: hypothetical protein GX717_03385, partial [Clostridiaceae bacterium]|nr:hypothetical protein [Clostridiaceae bacterium]
GDIGRTAAYTGIDVIMDIGPLEGMTIGAHFGPVGAAVGLGVGALSQGVQFISKRVFGYDIKQGLKDTVGNWVGDKLNDLGETVKGWGDSIGSALKGGWNAIFG